MVFPRITKTWDHSKTLASYGMPAYVRITIGTDLENKTLLNVATEVAKIMKENS